MLLPATPGWVLLPVVVCGSPPLLAGVCLRRWCAVCGVPCVVCGVWCAAVVCWWGCGWCVVWLVPRHSVPVSTRARLVGLVLAGSRVVC